jgi:hypothetical protein
MIVYGVTLIFSVPSIYIFAPEGLDVISIEPYAGAVLGTGADVGVGVGVGAGVGVGVGVTALTATEILLLVAPPSPSFTVTPTLNVPATFGAIQLTIFPMPETVPPVAVQV